MLAGLKFMQGIPEN